MHLLERNHTPTEFYYMNLYDVCTLYPLFFLTPPKINIEPEHDALEDDFFKNSIFHGCILRVPAVKIFRGIQSPHFKKGLWLQRHLVTVCGGRSVKRAIFHETKEVGAHERGNVSHHLSSSSPSPSSSASPSASPSSSSSSSPSSSSSSIRNPQ